MFFQESSRHVFRLVTEKSLHHLKNTECNTNKFFPECSWGSAEKPPTQNTKMKVLPSLGTSADASSSCHAATLSSSQINNPSVRPSIPASDSTSSGYQCHWEAQGVDKYTAAPTNRRVPAGRPVNRRGKDQATTPWPHSLVSHRRGGKNFTSTCFFFLIEIRPQIWGGCSVQFRHVWVHFSPILTFRHSFFGVASSKMQNKSRAYWAGSAVELPLM